MHKFYTITIVLLFVCTMLSSQESQPDRAPKQYTVEAGYYHMLKSAFQHTARNGINLGFDYAWQLTGLTNKKPPAYISVPIGYTFFFSSQPGDTSVSMLTYGWTVRHHLAKDRLITPYIGYGLLLNQLKIIEIEGSAMGHQTKFEFGVNFNHGNTIPFIQVDYSITRFPSFSRKRSDWIHSLGIKSGVKF